MLLGIVGLWALHSRESILAAYAAVIGGDGYERPDILIGEEGEVALEHTVGGNTDALVAAIAAAVAASGTMLLAFAPRIQGWTVRVEAWHRRQWIVSVNAATGIDLKALLGFEDVATELDVALQRNLSLATGLNDEMRRRIEFAVWNGLARQSSALDIAKAITLATGLGRRKAAGIAGDQVAKLASDLNEARQRQAGITEYVWTTLRDDRVRPSHRAKDGKIFSWDKPPKDTGHPGHDVNCRCVAKPYINIEALIEAKAA